MSTTVPQAHHFARGLIVLSVQLCIALSVSLLWPSKYCTMVLKRITAKRLRGLTKYMYVSIHIDRCLTHNKQHFISFCYSLIISTTVICEIRYYEHQLIWKMERMKQYLYIL